MSWYYLNFFCFFWNVSFLASQLLQHYFYFIISSNFCLKNTMQLEHGVHWNARNRIKNWYLVSILHTNHLGDSGMQNNPTICIKPETLPEDTIVENHLKNTWLVLIKSSTEEIENLPMKPKIRQLTKDPII